MMIKNFDFSPLELVKELDHYIVGQSQAKKSIALAIKNRCRRSKLSRYEKESVIPHNILMVGNTGVGKTALIKQVSSLLDFPFVKVEASKFTEVGYVGRDVESMVKDLVENAYVKLKSKLAENFESEMSDIVDEIILDAILAKVIVEGDRPLDDLSFDRSNYKSKLKSGHLDDLIIEIEITPSKSQLNGPIIQDGANFSNLSDFINQLSSKRVSKRRCKVRDAKKIILEQEMAKSVDYDNLGLKAIEYAANYGIIFIDEIDKISSGSLRKSGPDISREGVQRDLLPLIEGCSVTTKYGIINTEHILFVAAGAFHFSKPSDLMPELQGRFPVRVDLEPLSEDDLLKILRDSKNSILNQYKALFSVENIILKDHEEGLRLIANECFLENLYNENTGARRLTSILGLILDDFLFDTSTVENATIDLSYDLVITKLQKLSPKKDYNQYII